MTLFNKIAAFGISATVIIVAVVWFAVDISTGSVIIYKKEFKSKIINDKIQILTNQYGLKKIIAGNDYDLFFGQGYAHSLDRLWQMDLLRRQAEGRVSEIAGQDAIPYDKFVRALDLKNISINTLEKMDNNSKMILQAYSDGINYFIENNRNYFSFEFSALNYIPEKWEPYHSILISKYFAFQMSFSFWNDVTFGEIATMYNREIALNLIPDTDDNINSEMINKTKDTNALNRLAALYGRYSDNITDFSNIAGNKGGAKGSNSWAVFKNKESPEGGAILANDPHMPLQLPSVWYQNHIKSDKYNSLGYSLPGVPLILVGRNESVSWGITNLAADICDFYFEKTDESGDNYYIDENNTMPFEFIIDTIKVKGKADTIYYRRKNDKSFVISDAHLFSENNTLIDWDESIENNFFEDYALTFRWTATEISNEIGALSDINLSNNYEEFETATNKWSTPPLVFNYADTAGNIGLFPSGKIPKRNFECNPNIPNPGWMKSAQWNGFYTSKDLKKSINNASGYVYSANSEPDTDNNFFISNYWEPKSRADRIIEMLNESEYYSTRDARFMQTDILSPYAKKLMNEILPVLFSFSENLNKTENEALNVLENWDFLMSQSSPAASVYNTLITKLIKNTYYDELEEKLFKQYCFISSLPTRKILADILNDNPFWFDNKNTDKIESYQDIVLQSFKESIIFLENYFESDDLSRWNYGRLHRIELKHFLGVNEFLNPVVSTNSNPVGGNNTTINNTEYRYYEPFDVIIGASMRFIADMDDDNVLMSMPGGNSGDPMHPQYSDQFRLWLNGGYIQVNFKDESEYNDFISIFPD